MLAVFLDLENKIKWPLLQQVDFFEHFDIVKKFYLYIDNL